MRNREEIELEEDEDDELVEVYECICSECHGTFLLPLDTEIDKCPLCNSKFTSPSIKL